MPFIARFVYYVLFKKNSDSMQGFSYCLSASKKASLRKHFTFLWYFSSALPTNGIQPISVCNNPTHGPNWTIFTRSNNYTEVQFHLAPFLSFFPHFQFDETEPKHKNGGWAILHSFELILLQIALACLCVCVCVCCTWQHQHPFGIRLMGREDAVNRQCRAYCSLCMFASWQQATIVA